MGRLILVIIFFCIQVFSIHVFSQEPPALLLAKNYQQGTDVTQYLISEKYDGVRAFWDGKKLVSRQGYEIHAPSWFTKDLPKIKLDGELWLGRGKFDALSGAVRKDKPIDAEWKHIQYQIFELPNAKGTFEARAKKIIEIVKKANLSQLKAVAQLRLRYEMALNARLKQVVKVGGEGLMLHRADALYIKGRSDYFLSLNRAMMPKQKSLGIP
jgi:DNA ligase 1